MRSGIRRPVGAAVAVAATALVGACTAVPGTSPEPIPGPTAERPGLLDPDALTEYTGASTITRGTVVIEGARFTGRLTVTGGDVTIRNSTFAFEDRIHLRVTGGTVQVEHSEFDGMDTIAAADDIGASGAGLTVRWSRFTRLVNALRLSSDSVAEHNVITDPNDAYGPARTDGIEIYRGSDIVVRSNQIDIVHGAGATGCVSIATELGDVSDVLVEDNDLTGGTYGLYARVHGQGDALTDVRVRDNRWHSPHRYGTHAVDQRSSISQWSGNTFDGAELDL